MGKINEHEHTSSIDCGVFITDSLADDFCLLKGFILQLSILNLSKMPSENPPSSKEDPDKRIDETEAGNPETPDGTNATIAECIRKIKSMTPEKSEEMMDEILTAVELYHQGEREKMSPEQREELERMCEEEIDI